MAGTLGAAITTAPFVSSAADGSSLVLIEKKTITANASSATFSGLNGETDSLYILHYRLQNNGSGGAGEAIYDLRPNSLTTNMRVSFLEFNDVSTSTAGASTLELTRIANGNQGSGIIWIKANRLSNSIAFERFFWVLGASDSSAANQTGTVHSMNWSDTSTTITSLLIAGDLANSIGNGTELVLYRVAQS